jgi:hypothetical protein
MKIDEKQIQKKVSKRKDPELIASYYIEREIHRWNYGIFLNIANSKFYDWRSESNEDFS